MRTLPTWNTKTRPNRGVAQGGPRRITRDRTTTVRPPFLRTSIPPCPPSSTEVHLKGSDSTSDTEQHPELDTVHAIDKMPSDCKRACDCCNIRKIKCPGGSPCSRCVAAGIACTSLRERKKSGPRNLRQSKAKILKQQTAAFAAATSPSESQFSATDISPSLSALLSLPVSASPCTFALDDQPLFTGTFLPSPAWDLHRISFPVLQAVILLYHEKLYGIWPLIHAEDILFRLETEPNDPEVYALATALCGATLSYLDCSISQEPLPEPLRADAFVAESRRVRGTFNYMEPVGLNTVLTSYFLHMHYGRQLSRGQMAAFYIREAITFAHILGLHLESAYCFPPWTPREQAVMRRVYFLLFMTERYLCVQQGLPTVLESMSLPDVLEGDEQHPEVVGGFFNLVTLFSTPGNNFFSKWTSRTGDVGISKEQLVLIQKALQRPQFDMHTGHGAHGASHRPDGLRDPSPDNPIQLVDIVVSQHWIRSLAWKLSILLGYVSTTSPSSNALSVTYPLEIAADTLRGIHMFPKQSFEAHGPGMEAKMCEIATVLADSILCSPPEGALNMMYKEAGAKAVLKGLADRIFETQTMNPTVRDALAGKIDLVFKCSEMTPTISLHTELDDEHKEDDAIQFIY